MMERFNNGKGDLDLTVEFIQLGLKAVGEGLEKEVNKLAGIWYEHDDKRAYLWGSQDGSVYLPDQKVPVKVPRLCDKSLNEGLPLKTYQKLQGPLRYDKRARLF